MSDGYCPKGHETRYQFCESHQEGEYECPNCKGWDGWFYCEECAEMYGAKDIHDDEEPDGCPLCGRTEAHAHEF